MIENIALAIASIAMIVCFIINSKMRQLKKLLDEESKIRKVQDDKLFYTLDSRFRAAMNQPTEFEIKQQQQQQSNPPQNNFDDLLGGN